MKTRKPLLATFAKKQYVIDCNEIHIRHPLGMSYPWYVTYQALTSRLVKNWNTLQKLHEAIAKTEGNLK